MLELFLGTFDKTRIEAVIGDREFIGGEWLRYLQEAQIPYVFRVKEDGQHLSNSRGHMVKANLLFATLPAGQSSAVGARKLGKGKAQTQHSVTANRSAKGELMVLIHSENVGEPLAIYARRWNIETMFKAFKTSGFDMESTHLTTADRLDTLFGVMAIAFCIAYRVGSLVAETEPPRRLSHGRFAKSLFRIGLDFLQHSIANLLLNKNILCSFLAPRFHTIT